MARRRKSKEVALAEGIAGFVTVITGLAIFIPGFRALIICMVCVALAGFTAWICYRLVFRKLKAKSGEPLYFQASPEPLPNIQTPSEQLRKMDWFQFEKLIELIYRDRGYLVKRLGGANPDGGVDLIVESATEKFVVQCKHWKKWQVGVRQIREFLGTLADSKIQNGIYVTLTGYSGDAKALADKHGIKILDESDVMKMLEESEIKYSHEVSELLSDSRKFCPKCEKELVLRTAKQTGNQFWGCSSYPRCNFRMKLEA
jgi:HJR/Mrr/RecB family endonuclease